MTTLLPTVEETSIARVADGWTPVRLIEGAASNLPRAASECSTAEAIALAAGMREEASRHYSSDAQKARRIGRRAIEWGHAVDHPVAVAWGLRTAAEANVVSGRIREAAESYALAVRVLSRSRAPQLLGQLLVGRLHVLALLGRHREAERTAQRARGLLESVGDHAYLAKLAMNRGNAFFQRDQHAKALAEWNRAAALFRELGVRDEAVLGLETNRAVALTQLDRHDEAVALFHDLEAECASRHLELLLAQVRMNAAYVHLLRAEFDLALRLLAGATTYFRSTRHPAFLASSLLNRGEIYQQLNLHREAAELADEAAPSFRAEGMRYDEALALGQIAHAWLLLGDVAAAGRAVRRARTLFEREENAPRVALMQLSGAAVLARAGRTAAAVSEAKIGAASFRRLGLVRWEAAAEVLLAQLDPARGRAGRLKRLLARMPRHIYPISRYRVSAALGAALEEEHSDGAAARAYRRAIDELESMRARIPTEDSKIAFLGDKAELYDRVLRIELSRVKPSTERLFDWMERARAQSLWDRMRDPATRALPTDLAVLTPEAERSRRHLAWLHARLSRAELGGAAEQANVHRLRRSLGASEARWDRMLRDREEACPTGAGRKRTAGVSGSISIDTVARSLPSGWGYVSFHLARQAALAIAVTSSGAVCRRLDPRTAETVSRLADRLDFQWGAAALSSARGQSGGLDRLRDSADDLLRQLDAVLWQPLVDAGLPPGHDWIVSPHGPAHRVPFPALLGPRGYRAEESAFSVAPSARIWRTLPSLRRDRRAWLGGLRSEALPQVPEEIARIGRHLASWDVTSDHSPVRSAFLGAARDASIIHLAAHGVLRPDNPYYSFIELADGPLFVHDLAGLELSGAAVVLTACSSGRGAAPAGDEWIGLARGFLQAGASAVIASLWPIAEEPTLALMDTFYDAIAGGESAPRALASAMRAVRGSHSHPWQWASFACLGGTPAQPPERADARS